MLFWLREIAGWIFVAIGLYAFWLCLGFVANKMVIEGSILAGVGFVLFRGGIHLIKVATSARVVIAAHRREHRGE